ncbi:MAG: NAD(P)-dependent oxidoreductase [Armatimonadetes bacterium]|nr:NAD(P)-dependent oxidoreductase [Armatimonadota bacterium]
MRVLITGAVGNAGQAVCRTLAGTGVEIRMADVMPPAKEERGLGEFIRCDTRTPDDVRHAVRGVDAVIHLAAWHCAHNPPVSDSTIFAVNIDGTFALLQACREEGIKSFIYASSMAYGLGSVYGATKVLGEDLCRMYHEITGASVALLRYHDFVPKRYIEFGPKLLRNGVDRRDVASATVEEVRGDFQNQGMEWCESKVVGATALIEKYGITFPNSVEQHDLSEAKRLLDWEPAYGFVQFLEDLRERDARGEDILSLWTPSDLSVVS